MEKIKCVIVGDGAVGKTCFSVSYTTKQFPAEAIYTPISELFSADLLLGGKSYSLQLWDTPGLEDYDQLRSLSYPETDVILVCFSVVSPSSYVEVRQKWVPEITHFCPNTPFLLVGTQTDLRDDDSTVERLKKRKERPITVQDGERLAKKLKAVAYVECSALTQEGVDRVLEQAVLAAQTPRARSRHHCVLL